MTPRRQLTYAALLCLAGAGVALFAVTRTWTVEVIPRPGVLPDLRQARSGAALLAWLPALAVAALAGAGALPATRAAVRRVLGVLLLLAGCGVAAGGVLGVVTVVRAAAGAAAVGWPVLCVVGGLLCATGGASAAVRGHRWPAMGARYERRGAGDPGRVEPAGPVGTREAWDALDRGEDPTVR